MNRSRQHRRRWLILLCAVTALALSGCSGGSPAPTASPMPVRTADPTLTGNTKNLEDKLLAGADIALKLETQVLSENSAVASVRIPDQILNQFLDALPDESAWTLQNGRYTATHSSGGSYVYEKPYSELITGSATDVYTIEDDTGWVEEIVDNTRYDPFTWVMSGEGGGSFAYMTVYELAEDASDGHIETVSRLNGDISGWSYDTFAVQGDSYRFIDLQLSPEEDGTIKAPYQWVLCVGSIAPNNARIEEIELQTDELALPTAGLDLGMSADALSLKIGSMGERLTLLTVKDSNVQYTEYRNGR